MWQQVSRCDPSGAPHPGKESCRRGCRGNTTQTHNRQDLRGPEALLSRRKASFSSHTTCDGELLSHRQPNSTDSSHLPLPASRPPIMRRLCSTEVSSRSGQHTTLRQATGPCTRPALCCCFLKQKRSTMALEVSLHCEEETTRNRKKRKTAEERDESGSRWFNLKTQTPMRILTVKACALRELKAVCCTTPTTACPGPPCATRTDKSHPLF